MKIDPRVLGVDIGATSVKIGLLNPEGGVSDIRRIDMIIGDPELMADKIAQAALEYNPDLVGVGSPGNVNHKTGLIGCANLSWIEVPLRDMLEQRIKKPVWTDNDGQCALMAEWHSGACKGARCAICITLGTGIGGAALINGMPWRGDDNTALGISNMITHADEFIPSASSKIGRFEYYASGKALSRMAGGKPTNELVKGAIARETWALEIFDRFIHELGIGLMSIFAIFKPDAVVLGGGISAVGDYLLDGIRKKILEFQEGRPSLYKGQIYLAVHHNDAGMIGAAALAKLYLSQ